MNSLIWIGGLLGLLLGGWRGLLVGALIGLLLGRVVPHLLIGAARRHIGQMQTVFLDASFAVMGAMAKADGRVSEQEIQAAEALFDRLHLSGSARDAAIAAFARGKAPGFDLDAEVARFAAAARGQRVLHQMYLQVLLSTLAADGQVHAAEHALLVRVARGLGMSELEVERLEALLRGGAAGDGGRATVSASALEDAYRVLGVEPEASDAEVKRAYRRLMSENHPDKLAGKGLPESMRELAEQKTRAITAAYDRIEKARAAARA